MSFDKAKMLRNAERFLAQGKVRAAISEYKRIVDNDPKDFGTINILGDLYIKDGDKTEAVKCYNTVADHYGKQGFAQKAIAVYNKILRITPDSPEVSLKLAQFYQQKGSSAEARQHYSNLAEYYKKQGRKADALAVWNQIAALDSNNTEIYLKIAETCLQDEQKREAVEAFIEAGKRFVAKEKFEQAISAYNKALELEPENSLALDGLVKSQMEMGFAEDAAKTLESLCEQQPHNRDILYLLIDCHLKAKNSVKAEKAVIKLVEKEPANYPKFLDVTESYLKDGDVDSAARNLSMTSEHLLIGGQADELYKWINEILAKNPEQLEALRLLVRYHGWQREERDLRVALERLAESAHLNNSPEDERHALSQLVMIAPQEVSFAKRLQELNGEEGQILTEQVFEGVIEKASEIPAFENFEATDNSVVGVTEVADFERFVELKPAAVYEKPTAEPTVDFGSLYQDSEEKQENFSDNKVSEFEIIQEPEIEEFVLEQNGQEVSFSEEKTEEISAPQVVRTAPEKKLEEELATVEYYRSQGYEDLANKVLDEMTEKYGDLPAIAEARKKSSPASQTVSEESVTELFAENQESKTIESELAVKSAASENSIVENTREINPLEDFRNELGFGESTSKSQEDYETHYQTGIAYKEMGLLEDAIKEFQDAVKLVSATDGTKRFFYCCNLLGHCFLEKGMPNISLMWFRRGMETAGLTEEELQGLRYEIANAYESGGEPERAVEYFEQIYAVNVEYRDVGARLSQLHAHQ